MANVLYGFHRIADLDSLIDEVGVSVVDDAITQAVQAHNEEIAQLTALFARPTVEYKTVYRFPGVTRLQPLDEDGRARKIRGGERYEVAFPLFTAGAAWGANYKARVKMTARDAQDATSTLTIGDANWMRDQLLAAILSDAEYSFDDEEHGALTVKPLANGDSTKYPKTGTGSASTDNHFTAQAASIDDANNPLPTIKTDLTEHPENRGEVVYFVAENVSSQVQGLATFFEVRDTNLSSPSNSTHLVGQFPLASYPGTLVGYVQDAGWVVEWRGLPSGYGVALTSDGPRPLAMREEEIEALRGFNRVGERDNHPFWEAQYMRIAGFGAWNRVGAVAFQIGSGTYTAPSGLSAPIF